eukprot:TRINITY_DN63320_c0_g1_i1.p1 TRINITY_DN63320_c0_g1~~TRINITY_DN63320_c0_g1_i1.p1  ORF type:complete len:253 (-),score=35.96 TRINITY_DN63320_c0_g1_i1:81-773(-)
MISFVLSASILLTVSANSVPIPSAVPGWQLGTKGAPLQIRLFYDLTCPDCKAAHYVWKSLLTTASPVEGRTYSDFVDMKVTAFALPYHLHSYQIAQVVPLLDDLCSADSSKCFHEDYAELSWSNWSNILQDSKTSKDAFVVSWAKKVHEKFDAISEQDILNLFDESNDKHNSDERTREHFKYAVSVGAANTPTVTINGVRLDVYPASADRWKTLLNELISPSMKNMPIFY